MWVSVVVIILLRTTHIIFAQTGSSVPIQQPNLFQVNAQLANSGQNSAQLQTKKNNNNNKVNAKSFSVNDEYSNSLAYPNSGYRNYNGKSDDEAVVSRESVVPATPEEIESSYKQSLINLKSQNGQVSPYSSSTDFISEIPQSSFLNVLQSQSQSLQNYENLGSLVQPHLPDMQINPGLSQFPEVYSTSAPIPPHHHISESHQTFESGGIHDISSFPSVFKGDVQNIPISVQQEAIQQHLDSKHLLPKDFPKDYSVNVHYPPHIQDGGGGLNYINPFGIQNSPSSSGVHLKANFRPSEPDLSKFSEVHANPREIIFTAPPMSSGFSPSFGPSRPLSNSVNSLDVGAIHQYQPPHQSPFPGSVDPPHFPPALVDTHNNNNHAYQNYHHQFQNHELPPSFGPHSSIPSPSPHPDLHGPSPQYKFIFMKAPSTVENPDEKTLAYLSYLAQSAASATAHATTTVQHSQAHIPLASTPSPQPPIYNDPYNGNDSGDGNEIANAPPNSFDELFPTKKRRQPHAKRSKHRSQHGRKKHRRKSKKFSIALNPSFKGEILPHHWEQLSKLVPSTTPISAGGSGLMLTAYNPNFSPYPTQSGNRLTMEEVLRRAYGIGIDPNVFGGELGTETEKFTRSTSRSDKDKQKGDSDEESSEEKVVKRKTKKQSAKSNKAKSSSKSKSGRGRPKSTTTTSTTPTPLTTTTTIVTTPITTTTTSTTTTPPPTTNTTPSAPSTTTQSLTTMPDTTTTIIPITTTTIATTTSTSTTTTPPTTTATTQPPITTAPTTVSTTTSTTTTPPPTTTTTIPPKNSTIISNSTSHSVHYTISVLPKRYDQEATSESRSRLAKETLSTTSTERSQSQNSAEITNSSEYSSSEEYDEDASASEETHLQTNGHQKVPLHISDDDDDHVLIPLYFESSKMPEEFSTAEYDDMTMDSGHKKKDLSSEMKTGSEESSEEVGKKKRRKIKPSIARQLIKGKGKKRVQKIKKPKNAKNYSKHDSSEKNRI